MLEDTIRQVEPTPGIIPAGMVCEDIILNKLLNHRYPKLTLIICIRMVIQYIVSNISYKHLNIMLFQESERGQGSKKTEISSPHSSWR